MSTIVAISTAPGIGGIGIIRMSGKETFEILEKIFRQKKRASIDEIKGYTIKYGKIVDPKNDEMIDEVLVSYFKSPKSYTTENMCEINSHGGPIIMRRILEVCLENGAEIAEPGEFTKRAFLNGRMDLVQAESVIDMINSKTEKESMAATNQLKGYLSEEIEKIRSGILNVMVDIEASIDYPEYDIEEVSKQKTYQMLSETKISLEKLKDTFYYGKIIKEGIKVTIVGKPNVGKSSLLNAILKEDRAIVTEVEGTTRDTIEEFVNLEGVPLRIIDTAGIRKANDKVEQIGIEKSKEMVEQADLVIAMFDISRKFDKEDQEILKLVKDKTAIIILNKIDLDQKEENSEILSLNKPIIRISALKKEGIEELTKKISEMFQLDQIKLDGEATITNARHKNLIEKALKNTAEAIQSLKNDMPIDVIAFSIKEILEDLGSITGQSVSEDIINEIFAKFCLGK